MKRSPAEQAILILSILFGAAPLLFATIRAVETGSEDLRMLWMALASCVGALLVIVMWRTRAGSTGGVLRLAAAALVIGTLLAGATAYLLGARAVFGIWAVAFVLAFCWAASHALRLLSLPRAS